MTLTTVEAVHREISNAAAVLANTLAVERGLVEAGYTPFFESVNRTRGRKLSISYDESFGVFQTDEWKADMRRCAQDAIREEAALHADLIAGLIVGVARKGKNYFNVYGS